MLDKKDLLEQLLKTSDDPQVQVGAIVTDEHGEVAGVGSNTLPHRVLPQDIPDWPNNKHLYITHAELNAILEALIIGKDLVGGTLYVNANPCCNCAKVIVKVGIKKVVLLDKIRLQSKWKESTDAAQFLFDHRYVEVVG